MIYSYHYKLLLVYQINNVYLMLSLSLLGRVLRIQHSQLLQDLLV
jgi:hypothetical protein